MYFNKGWTEKNNANIELWDKDIKNKFLSAIPEYNRCLIFCTKSPANHGHPDPCNPPDGDFRKSIALYYYREEKTEQKLIATQFSSKKTDKITKKYDAVALVKIVSEILGGKGGGGRKDFAQAGGTNKDKIEEAFKTLSKKIN